MRERLKEIIKLTDDDTFSHKARMVSIKKEATLALAELDDAEAAKKAAPTSGAKTGDPVPPKSTAPAGAPAK